MTAPDTCRTVRAAMFAALCVLLTALGHALMSDAPVPWWALGCGFVATGATAWALAGRERGFGPVVAFAVGTQTVLHELFSWAQTTARPAAQPMDMRMTGMSTTHMSHMGHMGSMGHDMADMPLGMSSSGMFAAHLLAALLCGLWLAHGERAAFRILRAFAGRLFAPLRLMPLSAAPPRPARRRARPDRTVRAPRQLFLVHAITSRGPPAGTAVV
ncbi:hypothetical protein A8W25_00980 [Streptomyces sp. ERV7]|uniref:hypothetical protein n=1 Tax=Streptomyces sp. ERV7 TaxID=1322334 RepID=UPI0007F4727D|nr:hypothetical protein [Streptomyces sp. ERV7]OAR26901.1 hypothetical protein A8W25_00980 [Streptomyces sp. ERV7]